jgi:hypothetical protein
MPFSPSIHPSLLGCGSLPAHASC